MLGSTCDATLDDPSQRDAAELWVTIAARSVDQRRPRRCLRRHVLPKRSLTDCGLSVRRLRIGSRVDHTRRLLLRLNAAEDGMTGRSPFAVDDDKDDDPRTDGRGDETFRLPNVKDVQIDV